MGVDPKLVNTFDAFRKKRNLAGYERAGFVSDADAKAVRDLAEQLAKDVFAWLAMQHPELVQ